PQGHRPALPRSGFWRYGAARRCRRPAVVRACELLSGCCPSSRVRPSCASRSVLRGYVGRVLALRPATATDVPLLTEWSLRPHVIRATTEAPNATEAWEGADWAEEVAMRDEVGADVHEILIAELDGRPIGMVAVQDAHREPTHYWGDVGRGVRA